MDSVMGSLTKAIQSLGETLHYRSGSSSAQEPEESAVYQLPLMSQHNSNLATLIENAGRIRFREAGKPDAIHDHTSKFLKVDYQTNPSDIIHFMRKKWKMKKPKLLISVTGGANNFSLGGQLRDSFRRGLIKTALSTNAWIISGGTHTGVMKYVGEAVKDYGLDAGLDVVAIGIATWGVIENRDQLQDYLLTQAAPGSSPQTFQYSVTKTTSLDPNHTHFILVDSRKKEFGGEVNLRGRIERYLVAKGVKFNVCLLVEGGPQSLKTVLNAVRSESPVVVIRGTGRIADILANVYDSAENGTEWKKETRRQIQNSPMVKDLNIDVFLSYLQECMENRHVFTFCNLDETVDLPGAILNGLLKAAKADWKAQLKIAMIWNRADVAKERLFCPGKEWTPEDLFEPFHDALIHNQVEFIHLFLEQGMPVQEYLTHRELENLYNETASDSLLYHLLDKQRSDRSMKFTLTDVSNVIRSHTFAEYQLVESRDTYRTGYHRPAQRIHYTEDDYSGRYSSVKEHHDSISEQRAFTHPFQELFLYAILQDRFDMAKLFWERSQEPVAAALTATNILKTIARWNDFSFPDECADMSKSANLLEKMAVGVLDECQDSNAAKTTTLLKTTRPKWGNTSCMKIGFSAENLDFTSHTSVQNVLNKMWLGEISGAVSSFRTSLVTFFPLAMWLITFDSDEIDPKQHPMNNRGHENTDGQVEVTKVKLKQQMSTDWDANDYRTTDISGGVDTSDVFFDEDETEQVDGTLTREISEVEIKPGRNLTACERLTLFYTSPMVKFRLHLISYFALLALFSYIMLVNFHEEISTPEIVLIVWVGSLFCEEVRQMVQADSKTWKGRIQTWFGDTWNKMDVVNLLLFALGVVLRFIPTLIDAARIVLCINLMLFYVRVLNSFLVAKTLGPKLLMIGRMMLDLILFIAILLVFLLSYGIASHAMLFPNETDADSLFRGILYRAYFQVFGELYLDVIEGQSDCTTNTTLIENGFPECPNNSWTGVVLLAGYMLISNVLLLNLLIAMFSYTFTVVQENTDAFWKYHRYELIKEYIDKPFLVPPFIVFSHVFIFMKFLFLKNCAQPDGDKTDLHDEDDEISLMHWESLQLESYIAKERENSVKDIGKQVQLLTKKLETVENVVKRQSFIEKRLENVERQVKKMHADMKDGMTDILALLKKK